MDKINHQMQNWNARIGEQLAIFFLAFDKSIFNIINTIMFFLFCYLALVYAIGDFPDINKTSSYFFIIVVFAIIILFIPVLGEIFFWLAGSSNYLWALVLLLAFALPYRFLASDKDIFKGKKFVSTCYCLTGILAGMTNENTVPIVILASTLLLISLIDRNNFLRKIPKWYLPSLFFLVVGYLILILSPSTQIRRNHYNEAYGIQHISWETYLMRFKNIINTYLQATTVLLLLVLISGIAFFVFINKHTFTQAMRKNFQVLSSTLFLSFFSLLILVFVPYYEIRSSLLTWFFMIAFIIYIFSLLFQNFKLRPYLLSTSLVAVCLCIVQLNSMLKLYTLFYEETLLRHYQIISQIDDGLKIIEVQPFKIQNSRLLNTRAIYLRNTSSTNLQYPRFYGIEEIQYVDTTP